MNPVAFEIFGIGVRWYGIIMATAMLIGLALVIYRGKKLGYESDLFVDLALWVLPSAVVGARLYYVIFEFDRYGGNILRMINIREGGLAIHGGVIGGVIAGYIYTKRKGLNMWQLADLVMPSLILGQAIGRWGNYINGEAHGGPTDLPWAIMVDGVAVHPTFLYESIWNLMVFFALLKLSSIKKFDGEIVCWYMILYSIGRFFIEGLRTDSLMIGPLRQAQVISITLMTIGAAVIIFQQNKIKRKI